VLRVWVGEEFINPEVEATTAKTTVAIAASMIKVPFIASSSISNYLKTYTVATRGFMQIQSD
jgi:hypothetical protein